MIKSIYIMREDGTLLYSQDLVDEKFNANTLVGFCASITNFGREALRIAVNTVGIGNKNEMILEHITEDELIAVAISSREDDKGLVSRILRNILQDFMDKHSPNYDPSDVDVFDMQMVVKLNVERRTSPPPLYRATLASLVLAASSYGIVMLSVLFARYFTLPLVDEVAINNQKSPVMSLIALYAILLFFTLAVPSFIAGYIVGNKNQSLLVGMVSVFISMAWYGIGSQSAIVHIIMLSLPVAIGASLFFAYIGQKMSSRTRLIGISGRGR